MNEYYNTKNIRDLLTNGFSEPELRELCFYETEFREVNNRLSEKSSKNKIIQEIIDYAIRQVKIDSLLDWAKTHNPERFKKHKPYVDASNTVDFGSFLALENNDLGYGINLGGVYQNIPLKLAAIDWAGYGTNGQVRSGWLYIPQLTASHSVAFFKIHISDERNVSITLRQHG